MESQNYYRKVIMEKVTKAAIITSPAFTKSWQDLKSALVGLCIMVAGTIVTALIDTLLGWFSGLDLSSVSVGGFPVLIYLVPLITALLNYIRKYVTETKYIK